MLFSNRRARVEEYNFMQNTAVNYVICGDAFFSGFT